MRGGSKPRGPWAITTEAVSKYFAYDKNRRMTTSTDGLTNATTLAYDQFDRIDQGYRPCRALPTDDLRQERQRHHPRSVRSSGNTLYVQDDFRFRR